MKKQTAKKKTARVASSDPLRLQREKQLALWAGVIFFMTIVVSVWVLTFKKNVQSHVPVSTGNSVEVTELLDTFNQAFSQTKAELADLQTKMSSDNSDETAVPESSEEIEALKQRLSEMEQRVELERFLYRFNSELEKQAQAVE